MSIDNYSTAMTEYQERARTATRRNRIIVCSLAGIAIILLAGIVVISAVMFASVAKLRDSSHTAAEARDRIVSCTDPNGECAKQGQLQLAALVASLVDSNLDVVSCAPAGTGIADPGKRRAAIAICMSKLGD